jgi:dTDP-4-dehydrorhamnose 3,5-epimerase
MLIEPTPLDGLSILRWQPIDDCRGSFARTFCRSELAAAGLEFEVVQANLSCSDAPHTLRGMRYQRAPHEEGKIVYCLRGRAWDAAVDLRPDSPGYRKWHGFELAAGQPAALHIPAGFAHGYLTLEPDTQILYLVDGQYRPEAATGFRWDDPAIGIEWPAAPQIILPRDREFPPFDGAGG